MIRQILINNFRCYRKLDVFDCEKINLIVGENGSGKTALLEAIFFVLATTSEMAVRFRQMRGMDNTFQGSPLRIEGAAWGNLFYAQDTSNTIGIVVSGEGEFNRTLEIFKGDPVSNFDLSANQFHDVSNPITLSWTDHTSHERKIVPRVGNNLFQFPSTGEDFENCFCYFANQTISSAENAARFSDLTNEARTKLTAAICKEYPWIEDLSIEVVGGAAAVFASVRGSERKIALPFISGGLNRIVSILLAMASRPGSVILIDEIENGIYFEHQKAVWTRLLELAAVFETQVFITTHSREMLCALIETDNFRPEEVALYRTSKTESGTRKIERFSGADFEAGMLTDTEVR